MAKWGYVFPDVRRCFWDVRNFRPDWCMCRQVPQNFGKFHHRTSGFNIITQKHFSWKIQHIRISIRHPTWFFTWKGWRLHTHTHTHTQKKSSWRVSFFVQFLWRWVRGLYKEGCFFYSGPPQTNMGWIRYNQNNNDQLHIKGGVYPVVLWVNYHILDHPHT